MADRCSQFVRCDDGPCSAEAQDPGGGPVGRADHHGRDVVVDPVELRKLESATVNGLKREGVTSILTCEADGVHLGQQDMAVSEARALLGPKRIIGTSNRTVEQALAYGCVHADGVELCLHQLAHPAASPSSLTADDLSAWMHIGQQSPDLSCYDRLLEKV